MIKNEVLKICLDNKNFLDALHLLINEMFDKRKYPVQLNKTNDPILNLTPENIIQHSGIE